MRGGCGWFVACGLGTGGWDLGCVNGECVCVTRGLGGRGSEGRARCDYSLKRLMIGDTCNIDIYSVVYNIQCTIYMYHSHPPISQPCKKADQQHERPFPFLLFPSRRS